MKKVLTLLTVIGITFATIAPANAWYRGGYGGYYGGWGYGGYGAGLGIGLGAALLGGVIGGAIAGGGYGYGGYGYGGYAPYGGYYNCVPRPIYDAWGRTVGYAAC